MAEELTHSEKARLLAYLDVKHMDGYDEDYYNDLRKIKLPHVADVDDRIRRALARYTHEWATEAKTRGEMPIGSYFLAGWIHGYIAGRTLKKNIFKHPFL